MCHDLDLSADEEVVDARAVSRWKSSSARVLEEEVDRLGGVLLVRPDDAGRASLDPTGAVETGNDGAGVVEHTAAFVPDRPARLVKRHPGKSDAVIADAPENDLTRDHFAGVGRDRSNATVLVCLE